jgi:hypothetical protein
MEDCNKWAKGTRYREKSLHKPSMVYRSPRSTVISNPGIFYDSDATVMQLFMQTGLCRLVYADWFMQTGFILNIFILAVYIAT